MFHSVNKHSLVACCVQIEKDRIWLRQGMCSERPHSLMGRLTWMGCSLEWLMLKLKLQYFGHLMWRADVFEKTPILGKIEGRRRRGRQRMRWLVASLTQWTWVWVDSGSWWWTGRPGVLWFMGSQRVGHDWATELNWTKLNWTCTHQEQRAGKGWNSGAVETWVKSHSNFAPGDVTWILFRSLCFLIDKTGFKYKMLS